MVGDLESCCGHRNRQPHAREVRPPTPRGRTSSACVGLVTGNSVCERERERERERRRPGGRVRACGRGGRRAIAMSAPVLFCPAHLENEPLLLERFRFCFRSLGTPWRRSGASVGEGCGPSRDASWHLDSPPPPPSTSYTRTRIPSPPPLPSAPGWRGSWMRNWAASRCTIFAGKRRKGPQLWGFRGPFSARRTPAGRGVCVWGGG